MIVNHKLCKFCINRSSALWFVSHRDFHSSANERLSVVCHDFVRRKMLAWNFYMIRIWIFQNIPIRKILLRRKWFNPKNANTYNKLNQRTGWPATDEYQKCRMKYIDFSACSSFSIVWCILYRIVNCIFRLPFCFDWMPLLWLVNWQQQKQNKKQNGINCFWAIDVKCLKFLTKQTKTAQIENSNRIEKNSINAKQMEFFHIALGGSYTNKCMKNRFCWKCC